MLGPQTQHLLTYLLTYLLTQVERELAEAKRKGLVSTGGFEKPKKGEGGGKEKGGKKKK